MEHYFVLLELPQTIINTKDRVAAGKNFWKYTRQLVNNGCAKIISSRTDTGICEELKTYLSHVNRYTTFVLLQTALEPAHFKNKRLLLPALASTININAITEVIDENAQFRVLTQC